MSRKYQKSLEGFRKKILNDLDWKNITMRSLATMCHEFGWNDNDANHTKERNNSAELLVLFKEVVVNGEELLALLEEVVVNGEKGSDKLYSWYCGESSLIKRATNSSPRGENCIKRFLEEVQKQPAPPCLCDTCNMINCKLQRDYGIKAVECNEYMQP